MEAPSAGSVAIVPLLVLLAMVITVAAVAGWIARYFRELAAERRRLRLEVSKLAHELEGLRSDQGESSKAPPEPTA